MTYVVCYLEKDDKKLDFGKRVKEVFPGIITFEKTEIVNDLI